MKPDDARTIRENTAEAAPTPSTIYHTCATSQPVPFQGDDVGQAQSVQRRKPFSVLAKVVSGANVLLLDEPTNNLRIPPHVKKSAALRDYEGAVILVTTIPVPSPPLNPARPAPSRRR